MSPFQLETSAEYSADYNGNYLTKQTDALGNTVTYSYDFAKGYMTSQTDAKGNATNYTYNNKDQLTSVSQGGISVSYAYDSNNQLSTITHNGFTYNFIYDALGRSKQTKVGTRLLVDNMYEAETGLLQKATYGNGDTREYEYDSKHRVTKLKVDGVDRFTYNYDNLGNLHSYTNLLTNETYRYLYDFLGRPAQVRTSTGFRIKLAYDEYNRVSDVKFEFGNDALSTEWIYGKSSVVYGVKYNNVEKLTYTYDSLMRRSKTTINTSTPFVTTYGYKDISLDKTTTQLNSISYSNGKGFVYTYDANGNILTIKDQNNNLLANYTYDALNQLTREDNAQLNKTITYTYDNGGNILSVKEYSFTTGDLGEVVSQKTYTYGNTEWKDLLTNYNDTSITYDTIGNPLNWINGETFTWSGGRQLTGITKGNTNIAYTYNDNGIRTSKTVNGTRTDYYLNGTAVIMQKTGDNCIWFTYDENDLVSGFRYNGSEYYYIKNAQNDIIGIIDSSGTVIANYTYDSWGNHISITDGNGNSISFNPNHIANINPFRYRGYYFDAETELYYINSRYYAANVGRFINADAYVSTSQGFVGNNMFAYCLNNSIVLIDSNGNRPILSTNLHNETNEERTLSFWYINQYLKYASPQRKRVAVIFDGRTSGENQGRDGGKGFEHQGAELVKRIQREYYLVEAYPFTEMQGFVDSWNKLEGEYETIYILCHGSAGALWCNNVGFGIGKTYDPYDLNNVQTNLIVFYSCNAGTKADNGISTAQLFANFTRAPVHAVANGRLNYTWDGCEPQISFKDWWRGPRWDVFMPN